jgi:GxxExxY protein
MNRQDAKDAKKVQEPSETTDRLAHSVIGAAIEVHRALGPGYLESVYESALAVELDHRGVAYQQQHPFSLSYRGKAVGQGRVDLLVEQTLIIELKTVDQIAPIHRAQVISYLKALNCQLGLLINFNAPVLKDGIQRIIHSGH